MPSRENVKRRREGLSFGSIVKGAVIGSVGLVAVVGIVGWLGKPKPRTFESINEAYAEQHPGARAMYAIFKENFPNDYKFLADGVDKRLADHETDKAIGNYSRTVMQQFMNLHLIDIMHAPSASLADLRKAQTQMALALQASSPKLCAAYDSHGLPKNAVLDARSTEALEAVATARMAAVAAGVKHPVSYDHPSPSDQRAMSDAMDRFGMTKAQRSQLASPDFTSRPAAEQCAVIVIISKAHESLPTDVADRLTVEQYRELSNRYGIREAESFPLNFKVAPPKAKTNGLPPPPIKATPQP